MDMNGKILDYPCMVHIPSYALYGEQDEDRAGDWLHWETVQARSRLHGYRIAPHRHERLFQVLEFTHGHMTVTLDDVVHAPQAGAVVVVPAMTVHGYGFSQDVTGRVLTLRQRDVDAAGFEIEAGVLAGTEAVADAMTRLIAEADQPGLAHAAAIQALLALMLLSLHRMQRRTAEREDETSRKRILARAFRGLVDQHFRQSRMVPFYASALGISAHHLNRVSREVLGLSALQVIERRVVLEARRQLLFSELSIKQIGADLGYEDPAYFTRFLTRTLSMPPGQFRRQKR